MYYTCINSQKMNKHSNINQNQILNFRVLFLGVISFSFLFNSFSCQTVVQQRYLEAEEMGILPTGFTEERTRTTAKRGPCYEAENYQIDTNHLDHFPKRYIRINFHFMNNEAGTQNISEKEAPYYTERLLHAMNYALKNNKKMWLPEGNDTPIHPINIEYVLTGRPDDPDDDGIYYHYDDSLYYYVHIHKKDANLFDRAVFDKYGVQLDTVLNFFIMPHHKDSMASKTYRAQSVGVALRNAVKVAATWKESYAKDSNIYWKYRGTINHEVGHILGISHAWTKYDGCEDTPVHKNNCYSRSQAGCATSASNNVMDYSSLQLAWTPCQIGKIHRKLAMDNYKPRDFLLPTWCTLDETKNITIKDSIDWPCMKDLEGNLTIAKGGQLTIHCRVSMPPNGKITIQAGGKLILDGGRLHQDCEQTWKGIIVEKQGDEEGILEILNDGMVEDVEGIGLY